MSKASDTLNAIKTALGMEVEVKLATMKLEDGVTVIEAETFEAGQAVVIVTEDEQKIALPEGEYVLENAMILKVEEEGIIASISEREEEVKEEEVEEEVAASSKPTETATPKKVVEAVTKESYFSSEDMDAIGKLIDSKLAEFKSNLTLSTDVQNEEKEEKEESKEVELTDVPASKPITHNPENTSTGIKVKYAQNRAKTTLDRVMERISNS
tara:strand:+ start:2789 stop:3424 length:636 start_codon:yes stop_codon:yes gene_type:complete